MIAKKMKLPGAEDGKVTDPPPKTTPPANDPISDTTLQDFLKQQKDDRMVKLLGVLENLRAGNLKQAVPMSSMAPILKEQGDRAQAMAASSPNADYRPGLEPGGLFDQMARFAGGMKFGEGGTPTLEKGSRQNTKVGLDDLGGGVQGALDATRQEAEQYKSLQPGTAGQYDDDIKFLVDSVMGRGSEAGKKDPLADYREPAAGNIESNTLKPLTASAQTGDVPAPQGKPQTAEKKKAPSSGGYGPPSIDLEGIVSSILNGVPNPFGALSGALGQSPGGSSGGPKKSSAGQKVDLNNTKGAGPGYQDGGVVEGAANGFALGESFSQPQYTGIPRTTDQSRGGLSGSYMSGLGRDDAWDYRGGTPQRGGVDASGGALTELANKYGVQEDRIVRKQGGGGKQGIQTLGGGGGGSGMVPAGVRVMKKGGSVDDHQLIQVGERRYDDPNYETSEVVLAAPGTVVAPIPKGMKNPSHEDAMGLIVAQLMKHINGTDDEADQNAKDPQKAAAGTVTSPNDPYKLLDLLNSYGAQRSGYDLGRRGINRDLELGGMRNATDIRGQDLSQILGLGRNANDTSRILADQSMSAHKIASDEREGAAERALKGQLGNRGLDINASKNNNDFALGKADQAFQRLMAGMRGGALSGVRAGRAPMTGALNG